MGHTNLKPWRVSNNEDSVRRTAKDAHTVMYDQYTYFDKESDGWLFVIARRTVQLKNTKRSIPKIQKAIDRASARLAACVKSEK